MTSPSTSGSRLVLVAGTLFSTLFVVRLLGLTRNYDTAAERAAHLDGERAVILAGALVAAAAALALLAWVTGVRALLRSAGDDGPASDLFLAAGILGPALLLVSAPFEVAVAAQVGGAVDPDLHQILRDLAHWIAAFGYAALGVMAFSLVSILRGSDARLLRVATAAIGVVLISHVLATPSVVLLPVWTAAATWRLPEALRTKAGAGRGVPSAGAPLGARHAG